MIWKQLLEECSLAFFLEGEVVLEFLYEGDGSQLGPFDSREEAQVAVELGTASGASASRKLTSDSDRLD